MTLTWSRTASSHALTISFDDDPSATFKITSNSRLFRKSKGSKSLHLRSSSKIDLFWDLSTARYHPGPEPHDGFYLAVVVDSALGLLLGDKAAPHQFGTSANNKLALVSRQEHLSGSAVYSTKARFSEGGGAHDVWIRCGGGEMEQNPILWVCVDKKTVMKVRKVQWNFRGNQTIFVDGMLVDLLWDVHDWFYNNNPDSGCAVFMFKARSTGLDSTTFWMHHHNNSHHRHHLDFSFMICACKN
ncbi:uncharacterized protein LOC121741751 [Salvia splendens]|nr:uncharacterized protein LOC121741751 [Salvia splendens]